MADNDSDSVSMSSIKGRTDWQPTVDLAVIVTTTRRQMQIQCLGLGVVIVLLLTAMLGVFAWSGNLQTVLRDQQQAALDAARATQAMSTKICDVDTLWLFDKYCGAGASQTQLEKCFAMVGNVEKIIHNRSKAVIFAIMKALEPQTGPINYWAVDEDTANEDSHLDADTNFVADFFNNSAYWYAQKVHMESVPCGGWSTSHWRPYNSSTIDYDLVYCEHVSEDTGVSSEETSKGLRVCGGFALFSFPIP